MRRDALRTAILRVVDDLVRVEPWASISMSKVADAAGVSRQTLYNAFGSRDDLAGAYVVWAGNDLLDEIERALTERRDDLADAVVAAFELFLSFAPSHPMVRALAGTSGDDLRVMVSTPAGVPLITTAVDRLRSIIERLWPDLPAEPVAQVTDMLVRLAISNLTVPTHTPAEAAAALRTIVGPVLSALVDAEGGLQRG